MNLILIFFRLIPYFIRLAEIAEKRIKDGHKIDEINRAMERISDAFSKKNRAEGAKELNDLWNDSSK